MPFSCYRRRVYFLGDSSWSSHKFWIFLEIMPNDERCRSLWASATLPVFRNLATKRWIVLPSGTLFLPKSFLHCRCVRRTDFVAKYASMISLRCYFVPVGSILVSKESPRPDVYTTWEIWKKIVKHNFGMKSKIGRFFGPPFSCPGCCASYLGKTERALNERYIEHSYYDKSSAVWTHWWIWSY